MLKWIKKFFAEWKRIEDTYGKNQHECCTDCPLDGGADNKGNG